MKQLVLIAAVVLLAAQSLRAEVLEKTKKVGSTTVQYKVVLPNGYDPAKAYPAILALGGGLDTLTVDGACRRLGETPLAAALDLA